MRLVLDTDVVVSAFRSDQGASRQLILAALDKRFVMLASVPLFLEYEAVLTRPEQMKDIGLSFVETTAVLDGLAAIIEPVELRFLWRPLAADPNDEMVLETAVNGGTESIATFNVRHLRQAAGRFGIEAARPGEIWRKIQGLEP
jgi:putative PIN family toxin of toxin-antitoxin system